VDWDEIVRQVFRDSLTFGSACVKVSVEGKTMAKKKKKTTTLGFQRTAAPEPLPEPGVHTIAYTGPAPPVASQGVASQEQYQVQGTYAVQAQQGNYQAPQYQYIIQPAVWAGIQYPPPQPIRLAEGFNGYSFDADIAEPQRNDDSSYPRKFGVGQKVRLKDDIKYVGRANQEGIVRQVKKRYYIICLLEGNEWGPTFELREESLKRYKETVRNLPSWF